MKSWRVGTRLQKGDWGFSGILKLKINCVKKGVLSCCVFFLTHRLYFYKGSL